MPLILEVSVPGLEVNGEGPATVVEFVGAHHKERDRNQAEEDHGGYQDPRNICARGDLLADPHVLSYDVPVQEEYDYPHLHPDVAVVVELILEGSQHKDENHQQNLVEQVGDTNYIVAYQNKEGNFEHCEQGDHVPLFPVSDIHAHVETLEHVEMF